ncbi:GNAT family N-acetyltransferase [Microvirga arsenatis]|uniref:GNAT family N-acetyltransferase n=1 Tax=Microvirga arsenatis TaxID=2692265 RepID=A0ABW9Z0M0_9HYPH|nr:GNAT family N-acetyltransferase [Microvirga arsenatis]NBJ25985.1 GNAT family N-acetyltransferase [Microvirga arsenatis]
MRVRAKERGDQAWIDRLLTERWGGRRIAVHGEVFDAGALPALIAGDGEGLATYVLEENGIFAELITLDSVTPRHGTGTALIEALVRILQGRGFKALRVTTTNDNLAALRFYQRRGFRLVSVRPGAVNEARKIKPSIPLLGLDGIPLRDEIELVRSLDATDLA